MMDAHMKADLPSDLVDRCAKKMADFNGFAWENCAQSYWREDARFVLREAGVAELIAERDEAVRQWKNYEAVAVQRHAQLEAAKAAEDEMAKLLKELRKVAASTQLVSKYYCASKSTPPFPVTARQTTASQEIGLCLDPNYVARISNNDK